MGFLKKNWPNLLLGVVSLLGLGVAVWQWMSAGRVAEQMGPQVQLGRQLDTVKRGTLYNLQWVEEKRKEASALKAALSQTIEQAERRQRFETRIGPDGKVETVERKPLIAGVLPKAERTQQRVDFRTAYKDAFWRMVAQLEGGDQPSAEELMAAAENLRKQQATELQLVSDPWSMRVVASASPAVVDALDRDRILWADPAVRASLERARSIRMYVDPRALAPHSMINDVGEAPSELEIWQAQMALWIQQDVVAALAWLNQEAADALRQAGHAERVWVGYLPVKHLHAVSIRYLGGPGGGGSNVPPGGFAFPSFTEQNNSKICFVVPMQIHAVVQADAMTRLIGKLMEVGFMLPVGIGYKAVRPNVRQVGYVYGPEKVVDLRLDLEAYYLHSVFGKWMPEEIRTQLENPAPVELEAAPGGEAAPGRFRVGRG